MPLSVRLNGPSELFPNYVFNAEYAISWFDFDGDLTVRPNIQPIDPSEPVREWFLFEGTGGFTDDDPTRVTPDSELTQVRFISDGEELWRMTGLEMDADQANGLLPLFEREATIDPEARREAIAEVLEDYHYELLGSSGEDRVIGTPNDDVMNGRGGPDMLAGEGGNDRLLGRLGDDTLYGEQGRDRLDGQQNDDVLYGEEGRDVLIGRRGADMLDGGNHPDELDGGPFGDTLIGGGGADTLDGDRGRDVIDGEAGNDRLIAGASFDILTGGDGRDTFVFGGRDQRNRIEDFEDGRDRIEITDGATSFSDLDVAAGRKGALVTYANTTLLLVDVDPAAVTADDFIFG